MRQTQWTTHNRMSTQRSVNKLQHPFYIQRLKDRVRKKLNYTLLIKARPGKGKSLTGLSIACMADPTFITDCLKYGLQCRVSKSIADLALAVQRAGPEDAGKVFDWEEGGVEAGSKKSMTTRLQALEEIFMVMRYKRLILITTTPYVNMFFKTGRTLLDAEAKIVDRVGKWNVMKFKEVDYNDETDTLFRKYIQVIPDKNGSISRLTRSYIPYPPRRIVEMYNALERDIKQEIIDNAVERLKNDPEAGFKKEPNTKCLKCGFEWFRRKELFGSCTKCAARNTKKGGIVIVNMKHGLPEIPTPVDTKKSRNSFMAFSPVLSSEKIVP